MIHVPENITVYMSTSLSRGRPNHNFQVIAKPSPQAGIVINCSLLRERDIVDNEAALRRAGEILNTTGMSNYITTSSHAWTVDLDRLKNEFKNTFPEAWSWVKGKAYISPRIIRKPEQQGSIHYKLQLSISEESKTMQPTKSHYTPPAITESLARFRVDHPDPMRAAFIMMKFGQTVVHDKLLEAIRVTLRLHGIAGLRADDKEYAEDLLPNIQTYMHGCGFGIVVFERLQSDEFNPNVAFEAGYMMAMPKPVLLLKDRTLGRLHTDLVSRLFRVFDPQDVGGTVQAPLEAWLREKDIVAVDGALPVRQSVQHVDVPESKQSRMEAAIRNFQFVNLSSLTTSSPGRHDLIDKDEKPHAEVREVTEEGILVTMRGFALGVVQLGLTDRMIVKNRDAPGGLLLRIPWDFVDTVVADPDHVKTAMVHLHRRATYDVSAEKWRLS